MARVLDAFSSALLLLLSQEVLCKLKLSLLLHRFAKKREFSTEQFGCVEQF